LLDHDRCLARRYVGCRWITRAATWSPGPSVGFIWTTVIVSISGTTEKVGAKTLHIPSHIRLTMTTLSWKRNRLLLGKPFFVTEYRTPVKQVSTNSTFRICNPSARADIFLNIPPL
jgi:hypothetical protein